jgi:hypothetical protein
MTSKRMTLRFTAVHQHAQQIGGPSEYLTATVVGSFAPHGEPKQSLEVSVKQTVGERSDAPLEIGRPVDYHGPLDYEAFRAAVDSYYRMAIGRGGSGIRIAPGASAMMGDNLVRMPHEVQIRQP